MNIFGKFFGKKKSNTEKENSDTGALGRHLIVEAFEKLYPNQEPRCLDRSGVEGKHDLTGSIPPIEAWYVYDASDHWHIVTVGLTDLYEKTNIGELESGIGFELVMRVKKRNESEPPIWPMIIIDKIATSILDGFTVAPGVSFRTGPIEGAQPEIEGFITLVDPEITTKKGPFGTVSFLLLVGLNTAELDSIKNGGSRLFIENIMTKRESWLS